MSFSPRDASGLWSGAEAAPALAICHAGEEKTPDVFFAFLTEEKTPDVFFAFLTEEKTPDVFFAFVFFAFLTGRIGPLVWSRGGACAGHLPRRCLAARASLHGSRTWSARHAR
jgi:hypothetical protein